MGEIVKERHIYAGGVETPERKNELYVLLDCHDEDGYGVYVGSPAWDADSFTTTFGYGPFAEIMAEKFFEATANYHEYLLSEYDGSLNLEEDEIIAPEWEDCWVRLIHVIADDGNVRGSLDEEASDIDGLKPLLAFITKWGFKEEN